MKQYKLLNKQGEQIITLIPGVYAGNTTHKIFGRLDCKSGKRMLKENRVFFASWKDAIKCGYRPCEKCKPTQMDKYPEHEAIRDALLVMPHLALWESGPSSRHHPHRSRNWHIDLNWQDKNAKQGRYRQIRLSEDLLYKWAKDLAIETAKKCNIPVLKHGREDFKVIGIPVERTNDLDKARDKKALEELMKINKVTTSSKGNS
ncbi:MAG: hypothetical protein G01um101413_88 [Parcubacteria group bacterium Gr01-1014_13]|nr:MAG: hypothetical protein G01um101413_88 [Parcubacteria group bacterium Gr01-1014_13]